MTCCTSCPSLLFCGFDEILFVSSSKGIIEFVEFAICNGANVNSYHYDKYYDDNGMTSLMKASMNGHYDVVELLLKHDAYINLKDMDEGMTALMFAAKHGHYDIVHLLLSHRYDANINLQDNDGYTALIYAATLGHLHIVETLLRNYADVTLEDDDGYTALMTASMCGNESVIQVLTQHSANALIQHSTSIVIGKNKYSPQHELVMQTVIAM